MNTQPNNNTQNVNTKLSNIITNPTTKLLKIKDTPKFGLSLIINIIFTMIITVITSYYMLKDPSVVQNDAFKNIEGISSKSIENIVLVIGGIQSIFTVIINILITSLFTLLFVKIFKGKINFKQSFSLNTNIFTISVLSSAFTLLIYVIFGLNPATSPTSLSTLINEDGFLKGFINHISLFNIWSTYILVLGLKIIGKLASNKAWTIAMIFFIFSSIVEGISMMIK
ncbi:YIP1 family protein [Bacillus thuringiensis]|uniref:YIP1 family protein n=1 Tax=Bacillus TaxID=1386 RepID=UPI00047B771A|nr:MULTISPECIES: YIP1 family protein [Bacillus]MDM5258275.1 YIP1 family protein [Bacillus toyonensis]PGL16726.1 YIP1 family protein [Bacillus thuringiensis]PGQ63897.1 YIP1 family protein [Bacillus thuringiensis]SFM35099.1 Yip1 domain-containing protein [Bacillus sp. 5mfcol3.1]